MQRAATSAASVAAAVGSVLPPAAAARAVGAAVGASAVLYDASTWSWWHYPAWTVVLVAALELVAQAAVVAGRAACYGRSIPVTGSSLEALTAKDWAFIGFGKAGVGVLTYHLVRFSWLHPAMRWAPADPSVLLAAVHVPLLFVVYDFFYTLFHRFLHVRSVYGLVHKHHHRQHAPHRGNLDAINVHPFELVVGEYLHLLAVFLVARFAGPLHVASVLAFVLVGGVLASLNHTRFDVRFPLFEAVYQVRYHDVHHGASVNSNYGQYTMLWDRVFGSYKDYPERVAAGKDD